MKLLDLENMVKAGDLLPVTTKRIVSKFSHGIVEFDPDGLLSEEIFGKVNSLERKQQLAYIDLKMTLIHPAVYNMLKNIFKNLESLLNGTMPYYLDDNGVLVKWNKKAKGADLEKQPKEGFTGIQWFVENLPKIKFNRTENKNRDQVIEYITKNYKEVIINKYVVIPAGLREAQIGDDGIDVPEINQLYGELISEIDQMKSADVFSSDMSDLLIFRIQTKINEIYEWFKVHIAKKQGLIRNTMLGKRVDFSARSVITPDPALELGYVGLPRAIAIKIFEPFVLHELNKDQELMDSIENSVGQPVSLPLLKKLFDQIHKNLDGEIPSIIRESINTALERASIGRMVILKRDPALHRGSLQAFDVKLTNERSLQIHPYTCGAYNADFDGDTMAVYTPMTIEAQKEVREKMHVLNNLTSSASVGEMSHLPNKDASLGLWILTRDPGKLYKSKNLNLKFSGRSDIEEALDNGSIHMWDMCNFKGRNQTVGQALWDSIFPKNETYVEVPATAKIINKEIERIYKLHFEKSRDDVVVFMDDIKHLGYKYSGVAGATILLSDLEEPKFVAEARNKVRKIKDPIEANDLKEETWLKYVEWAKKNESPIYDLVRSGAISGSKAASLKSIILWKGFISDAEGNMSETPLTDNFASGYSQDQYFQSGFSARKGIADRVINTATPGDLSRKLTFGGSGVTASRTITDCKTKKYFEIYIDNTNKHRFSTRTLVDGSKLIKINGDVPEKYLNSYVKIRSPIYCKSKEICKICAGDIPKLNNAYNLGRVSATTVGERGTQLIMQTFHSGGVITLQKIDLISDIMTNML